jgi:polar amino acid transport system substrate-binding protein
MKRIGPLVLAVVLVVALVACAGGGHTVSPSLFAPLSSPTTVPAPSVSTPPATAGCTDQNVVASAPPPASMPPPGDMPAGTFMRTIQDRGKLIVGTSPDQLLFGYVNPLDGQIEGFDVDVLKAVAAAIFGGDPSPHIQFVTVTLAQRIPDVQSGAVDIVADTMTINCARRLQVDFSTEYYHAGQKVLVAKTSSATSVDDLVGQRVCAAAGSTSIDNLLKRPSHPTVDPVPDQSDCLVLFQQGAVDAISTDDVVLAGLAAQDPYAKVIGPSFSDEPYGMAISLKHPEFTSFVNGVLAEMRADGALQAIYQHWLGPVLHPLPAIPTPKYRG